MIKRFNTFELLVLALVVLVTLKTTLGVLGTFDVGLDDETLYLEGAHWLGKRFLPLAEASPLYPAWYRVLSVFEPDPLEVYFLNWLVLTASMPIILYGLARRSGAPVFVAAFVSIAWSMSGSVLTWPYVSKFAAVVLGLAALIATYIPSRRVGIALTAAAMVAASYARNELQMPSYVLCALSALAALYALAKTLRSNARWRARRERWSSLLALTLSVAPPFLLRKAFGGLGDPGRAFFAFGQHYALNFVEDRKLYVDPWTNWVRFTREAFPTAVTIQDAVKENPQAFLWHVERNITTLPRTVPRILQTLAHVPSSLSFLLLGGLVVIAAMGLFGLLFVRRTKLDPRLFAWLPLYLFLGAATAASTLIIYPRDHYVLPIYWLTLALFAAGWKRIAAPSWMRIPPRRLPRLLRRRGAIGRGAFVLLFVLLLAAVPTRRPVWPSLLASAEKPPPSLVQENVRTIELLRSLHLKGRIVMLEADHSRGFYANLDYQRVAQWDKGQDEKLWPFLHRFDIGVIVINDRLRWDTRFNADPDFKALLDGGEREDFVMMPVEGTHATLAVRKRVLDAAK